MAKINKKFNELREHIKKISNNQFKLVEPIIRPKEQHGHTCKLYSLWTVLDWLFVTDINDENINPISPARKRDSVAMDNSSLRWYAKKSDFSMQGEIHDNRYLLEIARQYGYNNSCIFSCTKENYLEILKKQIDQDLPGIIFFDVNPATGEISFDQGYHEHAGVVFGYCFINNELEFIATYYNNYYLLNANRLLESAAQLMEKRIPETFYKIEKDWRQQGDRLDKFIPFRESDIKKTVTSKPVSKDAINFKLKIIVFGYPTNKKNNSFFNSPEFIYPNKKRKIENIIKNNDVLSIHLQNKLEDEVVALQKDMEAGNLMQTDEFSRENIALYRKKYELPRYIPYKKFIAFLERDFIRPNSYATSQLKELYRDFLISEEINSLIYSAEIDHSLDDDIKKQTQNNSLAELVSNEIDAGATYVNVTFEENQYFEVEGNGCGMTVDTIHKYALLPKSSNKSQESVGRFGIGMLTALKHLIDSESKVIITTKAVNEKGYTIQFKLNDDLSTLMISCQENERENQGTCIRVISKDINSTLTDALIERVRFNTKAPIRINGQPINNIPKASAAKVGESHVLIIEDMERRHEAVITINGMSYNHNKQPSHANACTVIWDLPKSTNYSEQRENIYINNLVVVDQIKQLIAYGKNLHEPLKIKYFNTIAPLVESLQSINIFLQEDNNLLLFLKKIIKEIFGFRSQIEDNPYYDLLGNDKNSIRLHSLLVEKNWPHTIASVSSYWSGDCTVFIAPMKQTDRVGFIYNEEKKIVFIEKEFYNHTIDSHQIWKLELLFKLHAPIIAGVWSNSKSQISQKIESDNELSVYYQTDLNLRYPQIGGDLSNLLDETKEILKSVPTLFAKYPWPDHYNVVTKEVYDEDYKALIKYHYDDKIYYLMMDDDHKNVFTKYFLFDQNFQPLFSKKHLILLEKCKQLYLQGIINCTCTLNKDDRLLVFNRDTKAYELVNGEGNLVLTKTFSERCRFSYVDASLILINDSIEKRSWIIKDDKIVQINNLLHIFSKKHRWFRDTYYRLIYDLDLNDNLFNKADEIYLSGNFLVALINNGYKNKILKIYHKERNWTATQYEKTITLPSDINTIAFLACENWKGSLHISIMGEDGKTSLIVAEIEKNNYEIISDEYVLGFPVEAYIKKDTVDKKDILLYIDKYDNFLQPIEYHKTIVTSHRRLQKGFKEYKFSHQELNPREFMPYKYFIITTPDKKHILISPTLPSVDFKKNNLSSEIPFKFLTDNTNAQLNIFEKISSIVPFKFLTDNTNAQLNIFEKISSIVPYGDCVAIQLDQTYYILNKHGKFLNILFNRIIHTRNKFGDFFVLNHSIIIDSNEDRIFVCSNKEIVNIFSSKNDIYIVIVLKDKSDKISYEIIDHIGRPFFEERVKYIRPHLLKSDYIYVELNSRKIFLIANGEIHEDLEISLRNEESTLLYKRHSSWHYYFYHDNGTMVYPSPFYNEVIDYLDKTILKEYSYQKKNHCAFYKLLSYQQLENKNVITNMKWLNERNLSIELYSSYLRFIDINPESFQCLFPWFNELTYIPVSEQIDHYIQAINFLENRKYGLEDIKKIIGSIDYCYSLAGQYSFKHNMAIKIVRVVNEFGINELKNFEKALRELPFEFRVTFYNSDKKRIYFNNFPERIAQLAYYIFYEISDLLLKNEKATIIPNSQYYQLSCKQLNTALLFNSNILNFLENYNQFINEYEKYSDYHHQHIQRKLNHAIYNLSDMSRMLYIRELLQNSMDAYMASEKTGECLIDIKIFSNDEDRAILRYQDYAIGMTMKDIFSLLVRPGFSTKCHDKNKKFIGGRGVGFFTLYANAEKVIVKSSTGNGYTNYVILLPIRENISNQQIIDIEIKSFIIKENFQGTIIEHVSYKKNYAPLEAALYHRMIKKYCAFINEPFKVTLNNLPVNKKLIPLATRHIDNFGKIELFQSKENAITAGGLFIKSCDLRELVIIPEEIIGTLSKFGVVIDLPKNVELNRERSDFENRQHFHEFLKPHLYSLCLNAYFKLFILGIAKLEELPYDYFAEFSQHANQMITYKRNLFKDAAKIEYGLNVNAMKYQNMLEITNLLCMLKLIPHAQQKDGKIELYSLFELAHLSYKGLLSNIEDLPTTLQSQIHFARSEQVLIGNHSRQLENLFFGKDISRIENLTWQPERFDTSPEWELFYSLILLLLNKMPISNRKINLYFSTALGRASAFTDSSKNMIAFNVINNQDNVSNLWKSIDPSSPNKSIFVHALKKIIEILIHEKTHFDAGPCDGVHNRSFTLQMHELLKLSIAKIDSNQLFVHFFEKYRNEYYKIDLLISTQNFLQQQLLLEENHQRNSISR